MPIGKKIRVYDLAREVKQDTKRVMEDLRREGADISVPSNSVSAELADKVRSRYFPKAGATPCPQLISRQRQREIKGKFCTIVGGVITLTKSPHSERFSLYVGAALHCER